MAHGFLAIVLHAHLPFVRHPEAPSYMEEEWFFEAITETYVPLLMAFERLVDDDIDFRITVSFSPSLLSMMTDDLLKERYARKIDSLIELANKEVDRTWREDRTYHELAKMYRHRFYEIRSTWRRHEGDLVRAYKALQDAGRVELITCTATHPFFPLLDRNWAAFRAQVHTAADVYERLFGRRSQGMWLGECGYVPGVDELLREEGIRFFFVDTHGVLFAEPRPFYGVHAPIYCPSGVAAFGRDIESSKQVWSAQEGYPGDPAYRDFYRDIGFDLPHEYIAPYIHPEGLRTFTGVKYHPGTHASMGREAPVRPASRVRPGGGARGQLHVQPRAPDRAPPRQHGPAAHRRRPLRRGALRSLVVRGPDVSRASLSQARLRPGRRRAGHAERLPARIPDQPGGDAEPLVVGREGLRRLLDATGATPGSTRTSTRWPSACASSPGVSRTSTDRANARSIRPPAKSWPRRRATGRSS